MTDNADAPLADRPVRCPQCDENSRCGHEWHTAEEACSPAERTAPDLLADVERYRRFQNAGMTYAAPHVLAAREEEILSDAKAWAGHEWHTAEEGPLTARTATDLLALAKEIRRLADHETLYRNAHLGDILRGWADRFDEALAQAAEGDPDGR